MARLHYFLLVALGKSSFCQENLGTSLQCGEVSSGPPQLDYSKGFDELTLLQTSASVKGFSGPALAPALAPARAGPARQAAKLDTQKTDSAVTSSLRSRLGELIVASLGKTPPTSGSDSPVVGALLAELSKAKTSANDGSASAAEMEKWKHGAHVLQMQLQNVMAKSNGSSPAVMPLDVDEELTSWGTGKTTSPISGCEGFDCIRQYVNLPDDTYHWKDTGFRLKGTSQDKGAPPNSGYAVPTNAKLVKWTGYVLNMTSQKWPAATNHRVWWHNLVVIVPENKRSDCWATLRLDFGVEPPSNSVPVIRFENHKSTDNEQELEQSPVMVIDEHNLGDALEGLTAAVQAAAFLATNTGAIAASLMNLPNGYEVFDDDPVGLNRGSDTFRGYTYTDFLLYPDHPEILHELPVAKAVVRGMDAVQEFVATLPHSKDPQECHTDSKDSKLDFAVTGYSKLGTAAMVAGVLDDRVKVTVPGSSALDMIPSETKLEPQTLGMMQMFMDSKKATEISRHAQASAWTPVYTSPIFEGLRGNPKALKMHKIVDPGAWMHLMTKPALFQQGASDDLLGGSATGFMAKVQNYSALTLHMVPNANHDGTLFAGLPSAAAFIAGHMQHKSPAPQLNEAWSEELQSLDVHKVGNDSPSKVQQWLTYDDNCNIKASATGACPVWHGSELQETHPGSGSWHGSLEEATKRLTSSGNMTKPIAMYLTATYAWPEPGFEFTFSTSVHGTPASLKKVWPDHLMADVAATLNLPLNHTKASSV